MECQNLFSGKNKKNIINLSSFELAQRVVKVKISAIFKYFPYFFSLKTDFDVSCKETICMKCQNLFSGKNKKIIDLSSAELPQRVVKI